MEIKAGNRFEYLDSARGLAAIFVVWGHFLFQYGVQDNITVIANSPLRIFYNATAAVSFFFVLSGMVLSMKYVTRNLQIEYKQYFIARLFRIYPAFLVVLLISMVLQYLLYTQKLTNPAMAAGRDFWSEKFSLIKILKESFLFLSLSDSATLVSQRWSLIVEIQISLLIPFMILIAQRSMYWLFSFVFLVMIFLHESFPVIYFLHFALGILIAYNHKAIAIQWKTFNRIKKISIFAVALILYSYRYMIPFLQGKLLPLAGLTAITNNEYIIKVSEGLGAAGLLITLSGSALFQKILKHKFLTFVGKISYSIYLCHFIILLVCIPSFIALINKMGMDNKLTVLTAAIIVTTLLVILLSTILYYLVEKPFIQFGKHTAAKLATFNKLKADDI